MRRSSSACAARAILSTAWSLASLRLTGLPNPAWLREPAQQPLLREYPRNWASVLWALACFEPDLYAQPRYHSHGDVVTVKGVKARR